MRVLRLRLFGTFEARVGSGPPLVLATKKSRALLAYLAASAGQMHPRDKLAALLWVDRGQEQARQSLRQSLVALREALAAARPRPLAADRDGVTLDPAACEIDVIVFQASLKEATIDALEKAAELHRGPLLDGLYVDERPFDDWLVAERERLRAAAIEALERLVGHYSGRHRERAITLAHRLLEFEPLHEATHLVLMRLYMAQGRRDAALRQYRVYAAALERELRTAPGQEARAVYREILAGPMKSSAPPRPAVLVVDDDAITRARLAGVLTDAGYDTVVAEDGADALFQLSKGRFDLVLSDIRMPLLDGLTLLDVVRDKRIGPAVILMTAYPEEAIESRVLELGAADYVTKPVQRGILLARIAKALRPRGDGRGPA